MWPFGKKKSLAEKESHTGLIKISADNQEGIKANIVFVHGLGADRRQTWHYQKPQDSDYNQDDFWPKWLGEDLPGFKVWLFGYESKKFFLEKGQDSYRDDLARGLLSFLKVKQLDQVPLWFICHSLGGLVVKHMLRLADTNDSPILGQVNGVVFLATPHVGSEMATLGQIIGKMSADLFKLSKNAEELKFLNEPLLELQNWYQKKAPGLNILTFPFYETYNTNGFKVVNKVSANPQVSNQEMLTPVSADHINIAKCSSREDLVFLSVKQFIQNNQNNSAKSNLFQSQKLSQIDQEIKPTDQSPENQNHQWTHSDLYKQLKKLNFSQECKQVRDCIKNRITIGSFLLCGEKKQGIDILLERLSEQQKYFKIEIDLGGNEGVDEELILNKIALELHIDMNEKINIDKVFKEIIKTNREQNILLILKSIDKILPQDISMILTNFWRELIKRIELEKSQKRQKVNKQLFLFLVDYQDKYYETDFSVLFADKLFPTNFTEEEIGNWIDQVRIEWGTNQCDSLSLDCTKARSIFQESEGVPYQVYRAIYDYFDLAWRQSTFVQKHGM